MPPENPVTAPLPPVWATFRRFLPYLWPADAPALRRRVVIAMVLVGLAKAVTLIMPFAYKGAIDRMAPGLEPAVGLALALVVAYAGARFAGVLFDNLRNAVFEGVGQEAGRRLSDDVFVHLHRLSLRFHLDRRTGAVTKIVERGTKSIDTMLYFLLFNIAPTVIELVAVCVIFLVKFGAGLVAATLAMVAAYIWFTRTVTEWRNQLRRDMAAWRKHGRMERHRARQHGGTGPSSSAVSGITSLSRFSGASHDGDALLRLGGRRGGVDPAAVALHEDGGEVAARPAL